MGKYSAFAHARAEPGVRPRKTHTQGLRPPQEVTAPRGLKRHPVPSTLQEDRAIDIEVDHE